MSFHTLSFTVSLASSERDLRDACALRAESYGHHLPHLLQPLQRPDAVDTDPGSAIFLCRDKASGEAIGTARVQTSRGAELAIERCADTAAHLRTQDRAEIARFSARRGADPLVKLSLWKASYLYCMASQARWLIIGARSEALVRQYQRLGFRDVHDDGRMVPLDYAGGLPHRILVLDIATAERHWHGSNNALYAFMIETTHPDIRLFGAPAYAAAPVAARTNPGQARDESALAMT